MLAKKLWARPKARFIMVALVLPAMLSGERERERERENDGLTKQACTWILSNRVRDEMTNCKQWQTKQKTVRCLRRRVSTLVQSNRVGRGWE